MALAGQIPQRDVCGARRAGLGAGAVEAEIGGGERARDELDAAQILADQPWRDLVVDDRLDGVGAAKRLTEAGQLLVGVDFHPDQVLPLAEPDRSDRCDLGHGDDLSWPRNGMPR